MTNAEIKERTLELYDQLPQELEARKARTDIRDEVLKLNYKFFGYVASHTYVRNTYCTYEDKLNSAICAFLQIWWKYKYAAKYRCDLSFSVFFKPRISEMIDRELTEVKYSIYRPLLMEAGVQLGKHWSKVTYDDLSDPRLHLPGDKINSLKAIFGAIYSADLDTHQLYIESEKPDLFEIPSDNYNTIEDMLIHEMVCDECKLTDKKLRELANLLCLDFNELKELLPKAEAKLYSQLKTSLELSEGTI